MDRLPPPLDCSNLAKEWPKWKQQLNIYLIATNKHTDPERNKIALFLWLVGERGVEIYNTLFPNTGDVDSMFGAEESGGAGRADDDDADGGAADPENPLQIRQTPRTLVQVIEAFDAYCLPRKNTAMEAFKFNMIVQKERQPFADFETALRTQLAYCEFLCQSCHTSYADRMLRDRIIIGVQDKKLQLKLLDGKDEPLARIIEMCKIFEAANENKLLLERKGQQVEVHLVEKTPEEEKSNDVKDVAAIKASLCYNCGQPYNGRHRQYCPARNENCHACGRRGHFKRFCKSSKPGDDRSVGGKPSEKSKRSNNTKFVHSLNWADTDSSFLFGIWVAQQDVNRYRLKVPC
ncbi:uncharacterized protein LOC129740274 [Uranotaenia lowii]|uniref:uncharacterized protein LOC129740274 n=1 Tax=Uranotaenia lowii TaxID=190385 RepID=UPI002479F720|nr:uncharacterized protein LOC129740274 [Uranotaenia lowii]